MNVTAIPLLVCHAVFEDPTSHNITLLGMFTRLRGTKFPTPYRDLSVYTLLTGTPAEIGQLNLKCIRESTGDLCAEESRRIQFGMDGKRHVHIRVGEVRFPEPDGYCFRLFFDDRLIAEHSIYVVEAD